MLFSGNKCCFFHSNLSSYMNKCAEAWKINICCRKTTFLLKTSNNDAMLLSASFIPSGALADDSVKNQLSESRISKNLKFRHFLQIDFELHMCCHAHDLSNITNWQHIGGGALWQKFLSKFVPPPPCYRTQFSFAALIFFT